MTDIVTVAGGLAIATALWAAAIAKLAHPHRIRVTVIALGVAVRHSWPAVSILIAAEVVAALLILVSPRSPVSLTAVLGLFGAFAVAGVAAMRARTPIACACFGSGDKPLGWRQLAQLPVVAAIAVFVSRRADWTAQDGLALAVVALTAVAAWWAIRAWPAWQRTRAMRVALREAQMASHELELQVHSRG